MGKQNVLGNVAGAVVLGAGNPRTVTRSHDPAPPIRRRVRWAWVLAVPGLATGSYLAYRGWWKRQGRGPAQ